MRIALLALLVTAELTAQDTANVWKPKPPEPTCGTPRPAARCGKYIILDFNVLWPLQSTTSRLRFGDDSRLSTDFEHARATIAVGLARNRGPHSFGVAWLMTGTGPQQDTTFPIQWLGAEARYRRWLDLTSGWELSAGYARERLGAIRPCPGNSFIEWCGDVETAHGVALGARAVTGSHLTILARGTLVRRPGGTMHRGIHAGITGHGGAALLMMGVYGFGMLSIPST